MIGIHFPEEAIYQIVEAVLGLAVNIGDFLLVQLLCISDVGAELSQIQRGTPVGVQGGEQVLWLLRGDLGI